jgi:hypothetical protein
MRGGGPVRIDAHRPWWSGTAEIELQLAERPARGAVSFARAGLATWP